MTNREDTMKHFAALAALRRRHRPGRGAGQGPIKVGTALDFTKVYTFLTAEY